MATPKTITIDASSAANGIDLDAYFAAYFQGMQIGASSYYGGTQDPAPFGYQNGTQVGFRYKNAAGAETNKQILIEGENLAYDFAHYGPTSGHGISGTIKTITFGTRETAQAAGPAELSGVTADLVISGWDITSAPGAGNNSANPVYDLYNALRRAGTDAAHINTINTVLDSYAQNIVGSRFADTFVATVNDDTIQGSGGDDIIEGGGGNDVIDGGADTDRAIFSGSRDNYLVTRLDDGSYAIAFKDGSGTTTLKNVEFAAFSDVTLDTVRGVELPGLPPKDLSLSKNSVLENTKAGDDIGVFTATDPEGKNLTFSLVDDAGGLFELAGATLKVKGKLDYETAKSHKVRIKVSDDDGHIAFKDFSISVGGVDEGPENISISKSIVSETAEVGTRVGMLSAEDPEGAAVSYSLTGNSGGYFALTADGKLTVAKALDYEKKQSHTITVQAKDATGQTIAQTIKIDVGDVTESKSGTARNDVMTGKIGKDKLSGGAGSDRLAGNGGDDKLYGGSGNDKLTGGQGADDLWGGSGGDTFIFKSIKETSVSGAGRDTIFDFSKAQRDKFDLSSIDANALKGGNQAFSFIGTKAFTGKAGELRCEKAKSDTYIYGDVNGDKIADFALHLDDRVSLTKSYFVL